MKIRLPADLKARIEEAASSQTRTLNAEVVDRLSRSFNEVSESDKDLLIQLQRDLAKAKLELTFVAAMASTQAKMVVVLANERLGGKPIAEGEVHELKAAALDMVEQAKKYTDNSDQVLDEFERAFDTLKRIDSRMKPD